MLIFCAMPQDDDERERFEQLYTTYRQVMYYTANSILHDVQLSEDAVQQAFMRVLNHMKNISSIECPQTKSFMVIIVKNIAINLYNSRKKKAVLSFDELEDWTADAAGSPADEVETQESYLHLASLIRSLPENYRTVLLLKYDNGYSTSEIASLTGLSEENVKKRLQRAKKKLEQVLSGGEVVTR